jgi:hypothetical protein
MIGDTASQAVLATLAGLSSDVSSTNHFGHLRHFWRLFDLSPHRDRPEAGAEQEQNWLLARRMGCPQ